MTLTKVSYAMINDGALNINDYGASPSNTNVQNKAALQAAITAANTAGGGYITVPPGVNYGFVTTDLTTYPDFTGCTTDITVFDRGIGTAVGDAKAGAQERVFYFTAQTTPAGQHDGNGTWVNGDWAPYFSVNNTANYAAPNAPSRTADDNRRASVFFFNDGEATWKIGQGGLTGASATNEEMSNFGITKFFATGDTTGDYFPLIIERKTGNWAFGAGTNSPLANYQFRPVESGYIVMMIQSLTDIVDVVLRPQAGATEDIKLQNNAGAFHVTTTLGNALTVLQNNRVGIGTDLPTSPLQVVDLPVYASNAAAIAAGRTVGAFYRNGDNVCVVH